jgi:ferric-dicitrate binding protein FerR (iron transport regulator)
MSEIFDESQIFSYLDGNLSPDERKRVEELLQSSPEFRVKFQEISHLYCLSENYRKQKSIDVSAAWDTLSRKIAFLTFREKVWNFTRTAAAILLPLFLLYQYVVEPAVKRNMPEQTITLASMPGVITKAVLPDGSEVWLNSQSELTYPRQFKGKERTVMLEGEAYFNVVSDKKHRFNVVTPHRMTVSAYGTEFNVNAYKDNSRYKVTLVRGHVEVAAADSPERKDLEQGEQALFMPETKTITTAKADTYVETAWKDGKLVFRREKFENLTEKLTRKFGVTIVLEDEKLKDYEYTATFTDESLEEILELLKMSAPITYTITKQQQLDNDTFTKRVITIRSRK